MQKWVIGNWKMNGSYDYVQRLIKTMAADMPESFEEGFEKLVLCPPFPYLFSINYELKDIPFFMGAQNCHKEEEGACTGEVSAYMLEEVGCQFVIVGHSERRHLFHETDVDVAQKVLVAQANGLIPIVCVGEGLVKREEGNAIPTVLEQVKASLPDGVDITRILVAYEPVWAIGSGRTPEFAEIEAMHQALRGALEGLFSRMGATVPLLYGGSVNADNAGQIMKLPQVNGVLVGGASLDAQAFIKILRQAT